MSRRKVDYVYVPKKKIKKVVIDAKRGRKSIEKTVNQRQILDGAYVRASAMKEFPNGKFAQGGKIDNKKYNFTIIEYKDAEEVMDNEPTGGEDFYGTKERVVEIQNQRAQRGYCIHFTISNNEGWYYESEDLNKLKKELESQEDEEDEDEYAKGGSTKPFRAKNFRKIEKIDYVGKDPNLKEEKWEVYVVDPKGGYAQFNVYAENQEKAEVYGKYLYSKKYNVPQQELMIEVAMPYSWTKRFQIKNQYAGKTAEEIWTAMDFQQRRHFMRDHKSICGITDDEQMWDISWFSWEELKNSPIQHNVVQAFEEHIKEGQYKRGGNIGSYNTGRSWTLDHNQHNKRESYEIPMDDRKFANGGMTKNYISVGDIVLDKNDNKYYIVYEVKNDAATKRYFLPDEVAESIAFEQNPELIDWNKYTMYSDERLNANFSVGDMVYVESVRKSGVIVGISSKSNGDMYYSVKFANDTVDHFSEYELELISTYAKGGNIEKKYRGGNPYDRTPIPEKSKLVRVEMDKNFSPYEYIMKMQNQKHTWNLYGMRNGKEVQINKTPLTEKEVDKLFDDAKKSKLYSSLRILAAELANEMKRGGNIGSYNEGRSWTLDHNQHNKRESYEIPMDDRKYAKGGMTKFNGYKKIGLLDENDYNSWSQKEKERMYFVQIQVPTKDSRGFRNAYKNTVSIVEADNKEDALEVGKILFKQEHPNTSLVGATVKYAEKLSDKITDMLQISILDSEGQVNQEFYRLVKMRNVPNVEVEKFITAYKNNDPKITDFVKDGLYFRSLKGGSPYGYAKGGEIPDLTNMNIDHLFANGGRTYSTAEEKIYS